MALRIGKFHIGKRTTAQMQKDDKLDAKKEERKEKRADKKEARKEKRATKKAEGKGFWQKFARFNPAVALGRAGVLAGARLNFIGMSLRLYPAFITEEQAKKQRIKTTSIPKAKSAWEKVSKFFRNIGGNPGALEDAIKLGFNKPIFKTKNAKARTAGFDGNWGYSPEDEWNNVAGAEVITPAIGLLTAIIGLINKSGADKNPMLGGNDSEVNSAEADLPAVNQAEIDELERLAKEEETNKILGMPPYVAIGLGLVTAIGVGVVIYKLSSKK